MQAHPLGAAIDAGSLIMHHLSHAQQAGEVTPLPVESQKALTLHWLATHEGQRGHGSVMNNRREGMGEAVEGGLDEAAEAILL
jgi:hypothetical protein